MRKTIQTKLLIYCLVLFVLFAGCNSSSKITAEDEPVILFAIAETVPGESGGALIYVDNKGNIYYDYLYEPLIPMLEKGTYDFGEIAGQVSSLEVIENYNKFCDISEEARYTDIDSIGAAPTDVSQTFYALDYNGKAVESVILWSYHESIMIFDNETAEEIIFWMDSWEWELQKEGWDEDTKQWYPSPDWSNLECIRL